MSGYRAERASQQIHHQVSLMLERGVSDPRLIGVNVTRVEVSGDLRSAKIFVAPMRGDENATNEMLKALDRATGYFRREIARALALKLAPEIHFLLDHAIEKGEHFIKLMEQIQVEEQGHAKKGKKRTNG